ncbi:Guanyl-nucleotide exchange factor [Komagataella phaffii CBS 7435]|uniref:Guanyl-nucleotide exchange factor for the small G-protein Sec4p n=2 Tax=Komagataella phaffii TaxID=460519 RepID=C4R349_KOMPG|nr:Guanyl-nucleotide exchange factor for the small G-protein Sec4p [Komagataella phaffii GS115]AOA62400.1 GQ67_01345T0 [Komagataella phaffii]CAH2447513.1 Guanyl-nucleotide exchange factor [Komagataella phaffii CBS 7435]AOA68018.1 GQ68_00045T0 [Komagataella phaffii GS115]CAY69923.1 Guanyl-nucleotide exchange factor for the small G-protein Sec4p [Komagataella phaffii GS115]CCA37708.1 Guanyl-nucleotide exchange factor [Komagataella phaffii CBS 7435]
MPNTDNSKNLARTSPEMDLLSEKLVSAMTRNFNLETELLDLRKNLEFNKSKVDGLESVKVERDQLKERVKGLEDNAKSTNIELQAAFKLKQDAEEECVKLRHEIEELSASLFDEANTMVSDARKETHSTQIQNRRLVLTIKEKDDMIESLSEELTTLKHIIENMENERIGRAKTATPTLTQDNSFASPLQSAQEDYNGTSYPISSQSEIGQKDSEKNINSGDLPSSNSADIFGSPDLENYNGKYIFSPIYNSLRLDQEGFQDFKRFVTFLQGRAVKSFDYAAIKELALFKKLMLEDIEPALRLDLAPGVSYFNRKPFLSAIVEGRVVIEPISGINEAWKLGHQRNTDTETKLFSYPSDSPPVATMEECAICGESRNDILEHARLYTLKIQRRSKSKPASASSIILPQSIAPAHLYQYSLCTFCVSRIRTICELFALLRIINDSDKTKIWIFSREDVYVKAWCEINKLRAKIFWARIGTWDHVDNNRGNSSLPLLESYGPVTKTNDSSSALKVSLEIQNVFKEALSVDSNTDSENHGVDLNRKQALIGTEDLQKVDGNLKSSVIPPTTTMKEYPKQVLDRVQQEENLFKNDTISQLNLGQEHQLPDGKNDEEVEASTACSPKAEMSSDNGSAESDESYKDAS